MDKYNVHQRPNTALQEVKPDCFVVKNPDGSIEEVEFDYGCICMGLKSNNPVLDMLQKEFADVELMNIGDSKRQRRIILFSAKQSCVQKNGQENKPIGEIVGLDFRRDLI